VKSTILLMCLLGAGWFCKAQEPTEVNVRITPAGAGIHSIVFTLNGLDLYINAAGEVFVANSHGKKRKGWQEHTRDRSADIYYDNFDGDEKMGKLKSINGITIDYYDKFSNKEKIGKIRSIGNTNIDYYDNFDNAQKTGKVKSIGNVAINYYDSFDRDEKKGKMKSFGNYTIDYYDTFAGDLKKGRLRLVGPVTIDYYDQFSSDSKKGRIKSILGNTQALFVTVIRW
jgi:hypothetical protein